VAAGAIAEKWLRQEYGTEITAFVTAVGTVDMPEEHMNHPSGRAWTRHEIDDLGMLIFLRNPTKYRVVTEKEVPDAAERKTAQTKINLEYEDYFVNATDDLVSPAYLDNGGKVYNRDGAFEIMVSEVRDNGVCSER
jgi:hypothetical protein